MAVRGAAIIVSACNEPCLPPLGLRAARR